MNRMKRVLATGALGLVAVTGMTGAHQATQAGAASSITLDGSGLQVPTKTSSSVIIGGNANITIGANYMTCSNGQFSWGAPLINGANLGQLIKAPRSSHAGPGRVGRRCGTTARTARQSSGPTALSTTGSWTPPVCGLGRP